VTYTAIGDAINVAARMEQTAEPGTVQVSEDTQRLIAPLFEFVGLGAIEVKGKAEPIQTYRPLRHHERPGPTRGVPGLASGIVGRQVEMETLHDITDRLEQGRGGICALIGEAGHGKSRLIAELSNDLEEQGRRGPWWSEEAGRDTIGWGQGRSISYNTSVPYWLIVDLLSNCLELHPEDNDLVRRSKLTDALEGLLAEEAEIHLPFLATLLGVDAGPEADRITANMTAPMLQRRTFEAVTALIEAAAGHRPLIVVLEDLHWADAVSLALLEELMAVTDRAMLLLVVAMRPDRDQPSWHFHEAAARLYEHRYTPITVEPLRPEAAAEMVTQMVGKSFDPELSATLISRAEGNPFYLEELLGSLLESGSLVEDDGQWRVADTITGIDLSPTITGLLIARLDRLDEGGKVVAQLASVIGREFRLSELEHLTDTGIDLEVVLADLQRRNLLEEQARLPERVYAFRHALVQETAYQSVLRRSRRSLHARMAAYLEEERPDEAPGIAFHLIEAGEATRALPYLVEAGDRAARAMSLAEAIRFYSQALDSSLEDSDEELVRRAHEGLGNAYTLIPDLTHAASSYQEMLEFGRVRSEPTVQVTALNRLGFTAAALGGDFDAATGYLEQARRLAEAHHDDLGLAEYHLNSCLIATGQGDMDKAAAHDAAVSERGTAAGSVQFRMQGLIQRTVSLASGGRYADGELALAEAARAADESGDEVFQAAVDAVASPIFLLRQGRMKEAYQATRSGFETMKRHGSSWAAEAAMMSAYIARQLGRYEDAFVLTRESLRLAEELGQVYISASSSAQLAHLYAEVLADSAEVARWRAETLELIHRPLGEMFAASIWGHLGWADLELGRPQEAAEQFARSASASSATTYLEKPWSLIGSAEAHLRLGDRKTAREFVSEAGRFLAHSQMVSVQPALGRVMGLLALDAGDPAAALDVMRPAAASAATMGLRGELWRIHATVSRAYTELGRESDAATAMGAARETIESIVSDMADEEVRYQYRTATASRVPLSSVGYPTGAGSHQRG
jgi:tetratricopeptide (TPR) repeat protein